MAVRFLESLVKAPLALGLASFLMMTPPLHAKCYSEPGDYLKADHSPADLWQCSKKPKKSFCTKSLADKNCQRIDFQSQLNALPKKSRQSKNAKTVATYLSLMDFKGHVSLKDHLRIQTGRYPEVSVNPKIKAPCLNEILQTAYKLQRSFPNYNFVLNGKIKKCSHLKAGLNLLLKEKSRVERNIGRFHTPMHSVFLTDITKFNHFVMGQMGLYINVDKKGEIRRRLIDFQVGRGQIRHELSPSKRVGGFSGTWLRYSSEPTY